MLRVIVDYGHVQGGETLVVGRLNVHSTVQQQDCRAVPVHAGGDVKRSAAVPVSRAYVGTRLYQQREAVQMLVERRRVHRRAAAVIGAVHLRARVYQCLRGIDVSVADCYVQGSAIMLIGRVHVGARVRQDRDQVGVVSPDRLVKGRR